MSAGPEPGAYVTEYLEHGADFVVLGEGEVTLEELLPAIVTAEPMHWRRVHGIAFRTLSGEIGSDPAARADSEIWMRNRGRHARRVDIERYLRTWREAHGKGSVSIITARGCPYRCRWCSHQVFGMTHRRRKPELVVNEVEHLMHRYSPDMMWVADDVFTINHSWLKTYATEMKRRKLRVPFECISRADRLNEQVADLLAELGCFRLWIGSESGSQRVLDAMERGVKVEQVQKAVEMCRSRGIQSGMFLMWGYEGEEMQDIEETIAHVKRTNPDVFFTTLAYPIKGTRYYTEVQDRVINPKTWAETSDRESSVAGRRPREFYEVADRLLRAEVELTRNTRRCGRRRSRPFTAAGGGHAPDAVFDSGGTRVSRVQARAAAFDAIAEHYDDLFTNSLIGRAQRQAVWEIASRHLRPGGLVLELNCGTGEDALFLANSGMTGCRLRHLGEDDRGGKISRIARKQCRQSGVPHSCDRGSSDDFRGQEVRRGVLQLFRPELRGRLAQNGQRSGRAFAAWLEGGPLLQQQVLFVGSDLVLASRALGKGVSALEFEGRHCADWQ